MITTSDAMQFLATNIRDERNKVPLVKRILEKIETEAKNGNYFYEMIIPFGSNLMSQVKGTAKQLRAEPHSFSVSVSPTDGVGVQDSDLRILVGWYPVVTEPITTSRGD